VNVSIAELVPILLKFSIIGVVLAFGLSATPTEVTWVLRHPRAFGRTFLAMFIIMPIVAVAMALAFDLRAPVEIALVALALSPVPPILPNKELKAGGEPSGAFGVLVATGLVAILLIPFGLELLELIFDFESTLEPATIIRLVAITILIPLAAGLAVRKLLPDLAERFAGPVGKVAGILLLLAMLPILVTAAPAMWSLVGDGTLLAIAGFIAVGLIVGHFLAGGRGADRTVLALSTASRHPGIALAIAAATFPEQRLVTPAIALYLILGALVSGIYLAIRRKAAGQPASTVS
jgi:BASS family bile acid:Na+ symporter